MKKIIKKSILTIAAILFILLAVKGIIFIRKRLRHEWKVPYLEAMLLHHRSIRKIEEDLNKAKKGNITEKIEFFYLPSPFVKAQYQLMKDVARSF